MKTYAIIAGIAVITGMILIGSMSNATHAESNVINERSATLEQVYNW